VLVRGILKILLNAAQEKLIKVHERHKSSGARVVRPNYFWTDKRHHLFFRPQLFPGFFARDDSPEM
jgi:hypothetical protein